MFVAHVEPLPCGVGTNIMLRLDDETYPSPQMTSLRIWSPAFSSQSELLPSLLHVGNQAFVDYINARRDVFRVDNK
ncbi:hypothetical protein H0H93_008093 [Arthromyces matolae]|nr:hypothetical protein H0H93_008093 [Arthromyces matolae]